MILLVLGFIIAILCLNINKGKELMNKQQLVAKTWKASNQMRSKIEANEYKDYFLRFIFYKLLKGNDFTVKDIKEISMDNHEINTRNLQSI